MEGTWGVRYGLQPQEDLMKRAAGLLEGGHGLAPPVASVATLGPGACQMGL